MDYNLLRYKLLNDHNNVRSDLNRAETVQDRVKSAMGDEALDFMKSYSIRDVQVRQQDIVDNSILKRVFRVHLSVGYFITGQEHYSGH